MLTLFGLAICFCAVAVTVKMIRKLGYFAIGLVGIALCKGGML